MEKKILILFSRLSDYMLNIFSYYINQNNVELFIVKKKPDSKEAPFQFNLNFESMFFYNQEDFDNDSLLRFVNDLNPNLIICSGWANPKYNYIIGKKHKTIDCILTMDNQWNASLKQYLGSVYSRFFIVPKFKKIWVPGNPQKKYAQKLGFKLNNILTGWYVANKNIFLNQNKNLEVKQKFVFVGRYVTIKGIQDLCDSFIEVIQTNPNNWQLHCIGTGPLKDKLPSHASIKHFGFMQPSDLKTYTKEAGVFVLPSHFEPWGLVVQEFALAGFPLIVSDKVGAATQFVSKANGVIFKAKDKTALKEALEHFMKFDSDQINKMGFNSIQNGMIVNERKWAQTLNSILK